MKLQTIAITLIAIGVLLGIGGFFCPPIGKIDGSILTFFGEILAAVGLLLAWHSVDRGIDAKFEHGNTSVTLQNPDHENEKKDE